MYSDCVNDEFESVMEGAVVACLIYGILPAFLWRLQDKEISVDSFRQTSLSSYRN
jgi:hypothetical protein